MALNNTKIKQFIKQSPERGPPRPPPRGPPRPGPGPLDVHSRAKCPVFPHL